MTTSRALLRRLPLSLSLSSLLTLLPMFGGPAHAAQPVAGVVTDHPRAEEVLQRWRAQAGQPGNEAAREQTRAAAAVMLEGIRLYDNGDFQQAIARLARPELQAAPEAIRIEALKYTGFSYCVLQRLAECRQAFDRVLDIDPDYELGKGENGHPMWGPVFGQAKAARDQARTRASAAQQRERLRNVETWRTW
ncbi:TssQ family T6SS-associated lipoprotein [Massilia forsythiae]|uniref:TssQ family T6SS-associated lipoprotein n=1 Tax=Massilia forsythiae TaxID=2728020 RepID=A0A7Z2VYV6_9BURK|nr:TssQ family T6SS-associated lipoprotein [Massilia forsythiae]QJE01620.1 TssQ family T6SS-associated lipoprotein [Massilia forsythiae]